MTTDCTTGTINELDGCEPVGTPIGPINDPATVDTSWSIPDTCYWQGREWADWEPVPDAPGVGSTMGTFDACLPVGIDTPPAPTVAVVAVTPSPPSPSLPATGGELEGAAFGSLLLVAGVALRRLARRDRPGRSGS